jgi:hypothetical protein
MSHARYYRVYGSMDEPHRSGTHPVRIYRYRYVSGHWRSYGYVSAVVVNDAAGDTEYSRSIKLPYRGKWRLRAYAPGDIVHTAEWSSGYDYVTVY